MRPEDGEGRKVTGGHESVKEEPMEDPENLGQTVTGASSNAAAFQETIGKSLLAGKNLAELGALLNQERGVQLAAVAGMSKVGKELERQLAAVAGMDKVGQELGKQLAAVAGMSKVGQTFGRLAALSAGVLNPPSQDAAEALVRRSFRIKDPEAPRAESARASLSKVGTHAPSNWRDTHPVTAVTRAIEKGTPIDVLVLDVDIRASTLLMKEAVDPMKFAALIRDFVASSKKKGSRQVHA